LGAGAICRFIHLLCPGRLGARNHGTLRDHISSREQADKITGLIKSNVRLSAVLITSTVISVTTFGILEFIVKFGDDSTAGALLLRMVPFPLIIVDYNVMVTAIHLNLKSWRPRWLVTRVAHWSPATVAGVVVHVTDRESGSNTLNAARSQGAQQAASVE